MGFGDRLISRVEWALAETALPRPKACPGGVELGFGFVARPTPAAADPDAIGPARLLIYLRANWSPRRVARNGGRRGRTSRDAGIDGRTRMVNPAGPISRLVEGFARTNGIPVRRARAWLAVLVEAGIVVRGEDKTVVLRDGRTTVIRAAWTLPGTLQSDAARLAAARRLEIAA